MIFAVYIEIGRVISAIIINLVKNIIIAKIPLEWKYCMTIFPLRSKIRTISGVYIFKVEQRAAFF